jgi:N-acetylglucosamine malate deacetylase 1
MNNTVLIIAAHPDDEVLGCGGTIARHTVRGDDVHILILAEGITSRDLTRDATARKDDLSALAATAKKAGLFLGAKTVELLAFPDNCMDTMPLLDVIKGVETRLEQIKPSLVYTHHHGDLNIDHQITHQAVSHCLSPLSGTNGEDAFIFRGSLQYGLADCESGNNVCSQLVCGHIAFS